MKLNIKDLTEEQIKDLELQLQDYRKPKKPHYTDVKSWEDAFKIVKPDWYITGNGLITKLKGVLDNSDNCMSNVPSELHAKSILATCKLMVIADALNEGWKPDWNNYNQNKFIVYYNYSNKELSVTKYTFFKVENINFKSNEIAEYAMSQFKDLFLDIIMIEQ